MNKKLIVIVLALLIPMCMSNIFAKASIVEKPDLKVYVDGILGVYSSNPISVDGKVYLPLNELMVYLGVPNDNAHIIWNNSDKSITVKKDSTEIILKVGSKTAKINNISTTLDAVPVIYKDRVYITPTSCGKCFEKSSRFERNTNSILLGQRPDSKIKQVIVSSAAQLVKEIGSDTRILLKPGIYNLSSIKQTDSNDKKVTWQEVSDGKELNISNISNLTIEGPNTGIAELVIDPRYAEIIRFKECDNVNIKNIKAGHTPNTYECDAGVLSFEKCNDILIDRSELYGCGSIGLNLYETKGLNCTNTKINHCSLRAVQLFNCEEIYFTGCKISDHEAYSNIVYIVNSKTIKFERCEFSGNKSFEWGFFEVSNGSELLIEKCKIVNNCQKSNGIWDEKAYFFKTIDLLSDKDNSNSGIVVRDTVFSNNSCDDFCDDEASVTLENCTETGNSWNK